jgi:DUF4097 and DUF4098 domain-containing protein YvlB
VKNWTIGLLMMSAAGVVHAGEAVDKTLSVKPDGVVRIDNVRGQIAVEGWDRDEVSVKGTLDDETKKFVFETSGSTTTVKVETRNGLNHGKGSDLVVQVPAASRVRVDLVSADLSLKNLRGGIDGKTVSGNIDAADLAGRMEIETVSGSIQVAGAEGAVTFHSVSGDIKADTDAEEIDVSTVSGEADVTTGKRLKEATFNSVSGNVQMSADLADGARIKGSSTSGDVRLHVNRDAGVVVELSATSGSIKNGLTSDRASRGISGSQDLEFTMGDGAGSIELTTVSGKLELIPR